MDFNKYLTNREQVKINLSKLQVITNDLNMHSIALKIQNDLVVLNDEKFTLVVVGEFSRGKSTFVNAMLGKKVLPSSKRPTTNIISKIVYADRSTYEIFFKDRGSKHLTEDEFKNIKAQAEEDPSNIQKFKSFLKREEDFSKISYAVIGQPLSFCKNNVEVVDTPGTNDLNVGRMEITYNYLDQADAAILLLNATQALTQSELDFLKQRILGNQIKDIFVVVNFKDELNTSEELKVKNYVYDKIKELAGIEPKVFMVSSQGALTYRMNQSGEKLTARELMKMPDDFETTGFVELEEALAHYLDEEKGKAKLQKYAERTLLYIKNANADINKRMEALNHSADDIKAELAVMQPKVVKIKKQTADIMRSMAQQLKLSEIELKQYCDSAIKQMRLAAINAADGYRDGMSKNDIQYMIDKAVTPLQKDMFDSINQKVNKAVALELNQALNKLKNIWTNLNVEQQNLLIENFIGISLEISGYSSKEQQIANNRKTTFAVGAFILGALSGVGALAIIGGVLGWFFGGGEILNERKEKLKNQIRNQYDSQFKNFSIDVCNKYRDSVNNVCNNLQKEIDGHLDDMENQLKEIIMLKEKSESDAEHQKAMLNTQLNEINKIKAAMQEVLKG